MKKLKIRILTLRIKYCLKQADKTIKIMRKNIDNIDVFRKYGKLNCKYLKKYLKLDHKREKIEESI